MNKRFMIKTISRIVMIEGLLLLLPALVGFYYQEYDDAKTFLILGVLVSIITYLLSKIKLRTEKFYTKESLVVVSLIWIIWAIIGAIPFYIQGYIPKPIDAFFETVSGFTTTGSTILPNVEILSHSVQFWRIFTHWIGGMGVLVFVLAVIPLIDKGAINLIKAEAPGPSVGKLVPKAKQTAKILYTIYLILTLSEIVFLLLGGMSFYDATLHAFSTAGTGGFSNRNASIAAFNSPYIEYVISTFMLLFGINFNIFFYLIIFNITDIFHDEELKYYIGIVLFAVTTITLSLRGNFDTLEQAFRAALFQVAAVTTTAGFVTQDFNSWNMYAKMILILLMIMGACAGSTAGGIKVSRIILVLKEIKLSIKKLFNPRIVNIVKYDGKKVEPTIRSSVLIYITLYILIFISSLILISLNNFGLETTLVSVITTLGNVGPSLGQIGPMDNFSTFSTFSKLILIIDMIAGRLEILPVVFLFSPFAWVKNK